ncbi:hypothetical protein MLD38_006892 [Melastoma candidum]|uniref:Uncharacterized protein n=1 Tax=Melastoma candidum TaxID=119954 RepID=A0ACB9RQK7_9MYRT|nr:hypothetical protein MLD38_006892 [Melastoma candidum]
MLHKSFKPAQCKTALKLAASRIKLLKNGKIVQIKQLRREVAQLLDSGQVQTARIRVDHVYREEKTMGAYDLIEIYCELIASHFPIIESQKNCPIDLKEAIASVVFASPRCADVPELADVWKHFKAKYGKEFISASVELRPDCGVNRSLVEKLSSKTPDGVTKVKILTAIALEHNIKWDPNTFGRNDTTSQDELLKGPVTFEKARRMHEEPPNLHMLYNSQASPSFDIGYHKVANPEPAKNLNARPSFGGQNIPPSPEHISTPANSYLGMYSSGNVTEGYETRSRYSGDFNKNYMDQPDWNMEFTDATAAAQAAAESAERASIAARSAAELSSLGRVTPRYGPDSHGFKEERLKRPSALRSPGEAPPTSQVNNASVSRNSGLAYDNFRDERLKRPSVLPSPCEAPPKSQVINASVGRNYGLAYEHFRDERFERPSVLCSPGKVPPTSQVNNAFIGRNSGLAYDNFRDERLERPSVLPSPGEAPPKSQVVNASVDRNYGLAYEHFRDERFEKPFILRSPGEAPPTSQVKNAFVGRNPRLACDHFRDERLERPFILRSPGEAPPKSQVINASVGRNSGLAYDHFRDERLERPSICSPVKAPPKSQVNNDSVCRNSRLAYDHFGEERLERPSILQAPPEILVNNASVDRNFGLAYDRFGDEWLERPSILHSPDESPPKSQANNASISRNFGLACDHFRDEPLKRPPILCSPLEAPPKILVNNASANRSSGLAYDHLGDERLERRPVLHSPGAAPPKIRVNNASVDGSSGLAYDHFGDKQLEKPPSLSSPGESPRSRVNNASVGRNSGLAYDYVDKSEDNLARDSESYNGLGKSASYKPNPDVGSIFHSGPVSGDNTVVSDVCSNRGDDSEDDDSLSGVTKKSYRDAYKKGSKYNKPSVGAAVGDVDAPVYEQHAAGRYTEPNPWFTRLENDDGISDRRNERKNTSGEVNRTARSSEIHARRESIKTLARFTPEVKESYGCEKDSSRISIRSQPSCSSSFAEKKDFSSLSNEKAEGGFAEKLFDDCDEERISVRSNAAGGSLAVFDNYGLDDDVYVFDLDKGPTSPDSGKTTPERASANFLEKSSSAAHYSQGNQSPVYVEAVPSPKAASESEEGLPVTTYDLDGPSFKNEEAPEKSREPKRIDDSRFKKLSGSSKFTTLSEAEDVDLQSSRPAIHEDESEQDMTSDSGRVLPYGNIPCGIQNRRHLPPLVVAGPITDKNSLSDQRTDEPRFSPSNSTSTDRASDEDPDIHYVDDQVKTRPNRRMQTNFVVSHEATILQPKTESRPVVHDDADDDDDEEEEVVVDFDGNYWRKPSTRPTKKYSAKIIRSSSQSSMSDSDRNSNVAEGRTTQVSSGKSHIGAVTGFSQRTSPLSSYHSTSRKPSLDAENSGFSPRGTDGGWNSEKLSARTSAPNGSDSSGSLKWRSVEHKASSGDTPKETAAKNQSSVPSGNEDAAEISKPAKPSLNSISREDSLKRASHVHPKMPDYETFLANLQTLRANGQ